MGQVGICRTWYATEVKEAVMNWAKKYNLFIRSYGNDSFLIVGEESNYQKILKELKKFSKSG